MGVTWRRGSAQQLHDFPEKLVDRFEEGVFAAVQEVIRQAVEDMRRFTESRPSAKSGKAGRVESGEMLAAIGGDIFRYGMDRIVGQFGFTNQTELYYYLQTVSGFQHVWSGDFIEPTFAMRDAYVAAIQNLLSRMGNIL